MGNLDSFSLPFLFSFLNETRILLFLSSKFFNVNVFAELVHFSFHEFGISIWNFSRDENYVAGIYIYKILKNFDYLKASFNTRKTNVGNR